MSNENASKELSIELTVGDLKDIACLIDFVKDKDGIYTESIDKLNKIKNKITMFLVSIDG